MRVSIEVYFLTNLTLDALLLAVSCRGWTRPARLLAAAVLGGLSALLAALPDFSALRRLPAPLLLTLPLTYIAAPERSPGAALRAAARLAAAALLLGGIQLLLARRGAPSPMAALALGAGLGAPALCLLFDARRRRLVTWEVRVRAATARGESAFTALVDTGNRLLEPLSGLPVLIAEEALLRPLLPEGFDAETAARRPPRGFRAVGYGALGGAGRLACFRPESLRVDTGSGFRPAPAAWIAVYPGRMHGAVRALAPASFGCAGPE